MNQEQESNKVSTRISAVNSSVNPTVKTSDPAHFKLRTCDVYIGYHGQNPNLIRFCKWVRSELELHGIACFIADRSKYTDSRSHEIADRVIRSVAFGVVVVTKYSILNHWDEIKFFGQKKNLIPMLFETSLNEITNLVHNSGKDSKQAIEWLMKSHEFKLEANKGNWRCCVSKVTEVLAGKLGRKSVVDEEIDDLDEIPFQNNRFFIGRVAELAEIETGFFGLGDFEEDECTNELADEDNEVLNGGNTLKTRKYNNTKNVLCINGGPGMGKTELALEFAQRYSQRYKMVIWIGGEAQYLRQNVLNLSLKLGLDVSADHEKKRGRIRSFDEQETESFKTVKQELYRDIPYLLIIDNLETEGKDLCDLIPRNTGSTHVIITTSLLKVMSFETIRLQPLRLSDAVMLMTRRLKREYPSQEEEILKKFNEKLGGSCFGLWVIGSLLCEITISPSALFHAISRIVIEESSSSFDEPFWENNRFLLKVLIFCVNVMNESTNRLPLKMLLSGVWLAPSPVSANLLAAAVGHMIQPTNRFKKRIKNANLTFFCCSSFSDRRSCKREQDSALVLVKLGLARRSNMRRECCVMFHPITQTFARRKGGLLAAQATIQCISKIENPILNSNHFWASAFLVFGFKATPPLVHLTPFEMVQFIKNTILPSAIRAFIMFSRCNSALELLKICTNVLEQIEISFVSKTENWCHESVWMKKKQKSNLNQRIDKYVWQDVTLLKATLLETRAKLLIRGGCFDYGEELCRTCINIRTVMLGHDHAQTLVAQETLSMLLRLRSKS